MPGADERTLREPHAPRQAVHDLRNLFGVIASAGRLLERDDGGRHRAILAALQRAAVDGQRLTSNLLAGVPPRARTIDLRARLIALVPLLQSLCDQVALTVDGGSAPLRVRLDAAVLDAVVLELVTNACAAQPRSEIIVRARAIGERVWISVADDGCGISAAPVRDRLGGQDKGHGLGRIRHAVARAHGRLFMRSRAGRGTVVTINLPLVMRLRHDLRTRPSPSQSETKEKTDENRQPIAA